MHWFFFFIMLVAAPQRLEAEGFPFRGGHAVGVAGFRGIAVFAAMSDKFPCERALKLLQGVPYPAMSVLWGTFGDDYSCMVEFLERFKGRPHMLQIHMLNGPCRRNRRCLSGEVAPTLSVGEFNRQLENRNGPLFRQLADRVGAISAFVDSHINHNSVVVLSLSLEDNFTPRAASRLRDFVSRRWRHYISRNRVSGVTPIGIMESHDLYQDYPGRMCIVNEDGNPTSEESSRKMLARYDHCLAVFLWRHEWQNFPPPRRGVFIPPKRRGFHVTNEHLVGIGEILTGDYSDARTIR